MAYKYNASKQNPYHLSIGAVLMGEDNKIYVNHFKSENVDVYINMRKSMSEGDSIEDTLRNGLIDEFGATGEVVKYLGAIVDLHDWFGETGEPVDVEKTTLYFLVKVNVIDLSHTFKDYKGIDSKIELIDIDFLINHMPKQAKFENWSDLDESKILIRAKI